MEEAIISRLLGDSSIAALAGSRVYPASRAQGGDLPAIAVQRISGGPLYADDGEVGLQEARVQVDCWGDTYADAKTLARTVTDRLSAFEGTVDGVVFQYVMLTDERDLRESGSNATDYPFHVALDFTVWTERS